MKTAYILTLVSLCAGVFAGQSSAQVFARMDDLRASPPELWFNVEKQKLDIMASGNYMDGNTESRSVGGSLRYARKINQTNSLFVEGDNSYTSFSGNTLMDKFRGSVLYVYAAGPGVNIWAWSTHAHNYFLKLKYRTANGAGLCFHGFMPDIFSPSLVSVGILPEYARYDTGYETRIWRANGRLNFRIPVSGSMEIGNDFLYYGDVSDFSNYRIYNEFYAQFTIKPEKLSLRLALSDEYDSRPFAGVKKNDFSMTQSLVFHLGK